jgi:hypothetical protein
MEILFLSIKSSLSSAITFLRDGKLDTLTLRKRNQRSRPLPNHKNVRQTGSKLTIKRILNVHNIKSAMVSLTVGDDANTTHVAPARDVSQIARIEFDKFNDFASGNVDFDCVVGFDEGVGVADRAAVVGHGEGDALGSELDALDLTELVLKKIHSIRTDK